MERRSFLARAGAMLAALPFLPKIAQAEPVTDDVDSVEPSEPLDATWPEQWARSATKHLKHRGVRVVFEGKAPDRSVLRFSVEDTTDWRRLESIHGKGHGLRCAFTIGVGAVVHDLDTHRRYVGRQAKYQTMKCAESIDYTRKTGMTRYYDEHGVQHTVPYWAVPSLW